MTPEGKVKKAISATLRRHGAAVYYHMPVPGGYGQSSLDYLGFVCGLGFAIEAKRKGGKPTDRQLLAIEQIEAAGAKVFVIDDHDGVRELDRWLTTVVGA